MEPDDERDMFSGICRQDTSLFEEIYGHLCDECGEIDGHAEDCLDNWADNHDGFFDDIYRNAYSRKETQQ